MKSLLVKQCHPSSDQNFACLIRDGQKIHMVPWSFSALSSKEFWRTFWALTKKLHVCYDGESSFNVLALLHEMRLWGVVLWRLQLCWGLKDKTGIWLVNTLGRKRARFILTYRSSAGSTMGGNIYLTHILYDLGGIRGNSIRKWLETSKTLI